MILDEKERREKALDFSGGQNVKMPLRQPPD
jgi:hypothetical protein